MKVLSSLFTFVLMMSLSAVVLACPVCFSAKGGTLNAFRFSAVFLTFIPLIAFGSLYFWYRQKLKDRGP